ncbi:hypothetical protein L8P23_02350 [Enterobacter roggenkampii]|uniref:hypothetical protein n=1 Tax=Enterobacter roggenkampii TaxID=1812935 RepID=UPI002002B40B|nr:hypothetical protein [Enterobacter roggenkampii]MCK7230965.1 hypothetical protein [Enterobacter roggenkampii]
MSNKYEVLIKNARMNADCGEHMSPAEVTTLLNVVETTLSALAAENTGMKEWSPNPHSASMFEAIEKAEELMDDGMPELAMIEAFEILKMKRTPETDAFLAEVRAAAVDEVCLKISNAIVNCYQDEMVGLDEAATICGDFAAQIRKGVQS